MIDISLLRHFVAVVQTRSFTGAAKQVHASKPVISRSIKRLEDQVGTRLLDRTTRSVTMTPAGEELFREAVWMLERLALTTERVRRIGQGGSARLRIGICPSAEPVKARLGRAIRLIRSEWPEIDIELTSTKRDLQPMALVSSELDVGLMELNPKSHLALEWRVIDRSELLVWLPASWGFDGPSVRLSELHDRQWVTAHPRISPDQYEMEVMLCRRAGFEPNLVSHLPEDRITGEMMMACEQGAMFMHAWDAPGDPRAKRIEDLPDHCYADMVVAWAKGKRSPQIDALVHHILDRQVLEGAGS